MNKVKKSAVAAGLTVGLLGGGAAGAILGSGGVSGAQEETTTTVAPAPEDGAAQGRGERPDPSARLGETLAPLVQDGTITQEQADKVIETLIASRPEGGGPGGHGGGPGGRGGFGGGFGGEAAATALGITVDELRTALRDGQSIAQVAESKGVAIETVIDAIVAERTAKIEEKVTAGDLTREEADEKLAALRERVTEQVNSTRPARGEKPADAPDAPEGGDEAPAEDGAGG